MRPTDWGRGLYDCSVGVVFLWVHNNRCDPQVEEVVVGDAWCYWKASVFDTDS